MRRRLSLALVSAIVALAAAGFLSGHRPAAERPAPGRAVSSPLVELQAVAATTPRADDSARAYPAVLLTAAAVAVVAAGVGRVVRERRRRVRAASPAWSAPLRGPPRSAAC